MNALNKEIARLAEIAKANLAYNNSGALDALSVKEMLALFDRQRDEQTAEVVADCGAKVTVYVVHYAAAHSNVACHFRTTYKVNGKRAKAADVEKMFREEAPTVATREFRQSLGALVGM